ncbi:hypothetical protein [Streptomyces chryseus]|uniref:hypothetical protein n=1 Tax=Streptomyces chryseus TaxID=68186 RepID=UPI00142ED0F4|nr:hypothetical protein [Streptomyces chryseus]
MPELGERLLLGGPLLREESVTLGSAPNEGSLALDAWGRFLRGLLLRASCTISRAPAAEDECRTGAFREILEVVEGGGDLVFLDPSAPSTRAVKQRRHEPSLKRA